MVRLFRVFAVGAVACLLMFEIGCSGSASTNPPSQAVPSMAFSISNNASANEVLQFDRSVDGTLSGKSSVPTGGMGTGGPLENQGAVVVTEDKQFLLAVNPGSDDFSVLHIGRDGLQLVGRTPSGGKHPVSISTRKGLVYVVNAGGEVGDVDMINGFRLAADGSISPIVGASRALSAAATTPTQILVTPNADFIVVTERGLNLVETFQLDSGGVPAAGTISISAGPGPFGFASGSPSTLIVSEAGNSTVSSYTLLATGQLQVISSAVPTHQASACWMAVTPDHAFAYSANTGNRTLSGFKISPDSSLQLLDPSGLTAGASAPPFDISISPDGRFLYVLTGRNSIDVFQIGPAGALTKLQTLSGLPAGSNGMATI